MDLGKVVEKELSEFIKEHPIGNCYHFPQHHYKWMDLLCAHCAICRTDYTIKPVEGVSLNGIQLYRPSKN